MSTCLIIPFMLLTGVFVLVTMIRWFEQTADAFDHGEWNKLSLLVLMPFASWLFPSKISAGRPTAVPRHEPARGFGTLPKGGITDPTPALPLDGPPPGTPKEFIGLPKIPPKKPRAAVDPEKLAKLKQKMKEQGMLEEDE